MALEKQLVKARDAILHELQMKCPDSHVDRVLNPSDPSTYQYKECEWNRIKKKKGLTNREWMESIRRNGIFSIWSRDIYVSKREDLK